MKISKLHGMLIAVSLFAGCTSQPTEAPKVPAAAATAKAATATTAAEQEDSGPFRKVQRGGKTLYCDNGPQLGSRMAKPRCLTEDQFAAWKENNQNRQDELGRVRDSSAGAARAPGPGAGGR